ncbi:MAG: soluble cytochrome b562 [Phenylobacterium sp.]|jgi:soluble cytochrome b562
MFCLYQTLVSNTINQNEQFVSKKNETWVTNRLFLIFRTALVKNHCSHQAGISYAVELKLNEGELKDFRDGIQSLITSLNVFSHHLVTSINREK